MTSPVVPARRTAGAALALVLGLGGLAACGSDSGDDAAATDASGSSSAEGSGDSSGDSSGTASPSEGSGEAGASVDVTIDGDTIEPVGERMDLAVGEPLTLHITSDSDGVVHVHSSPEQELEFAAGESTEELTIDKPGVVEVELHEPVEVTLLQLEVR